jgi:hypothetical protein
VYWRSRFLAAGTCVWVAQAALAGSPDPKISGAVAAISAARIHASIDKLVSFGTRSTLSAQDPASIAAGHGIGAARDWLKSELERYGRACGGCLAVQLDSFVEPVAERIPKPTPITNVYAIMRGSDPQEAGRIVLVTGHYDSRSTDVLDASSAAPGANDDASGTAVSLECARVLSQLRLPATVVFLAVAGEEQNLGGSAHFARTARERGWNIEAVLDNDIVGGDRNPAQDPSTVRVFSEGLRSTALGDGRQIREIRTQGAENDSPSRELARYVEDSAALYPGVRPLLVFRLDRYLRAGDHDSFNAQGYAAVRFTEYREEFEHQHQNVRTEGGREYGDLAKFVDFEYVARVARLNAAILAELAAAPAPPAHVELTGALSHQSALRWSAVPRASRYEVLWRATTSPRWEHVQDVGAQTTATLDVSKDEMIFAVRAIDAAGHRSLPVVPQPAR